VDNLERPKLFITENGVYENPGVDESANKVKYHRVSYSKVALFSNNYQL